MDNKQQSNNNLNKFTNTRNTKNNLMIYKYFNNKSSNNINSKNKNYQNSNTKTNYKKSKKNQMNKNKLTKNCFDREKENFTYNNRNIMKQKTNINTFNYSDETSKENIKLCKELSPDNIEFSHFYEKYHDLMKESYNRLSLNDYDKKNNKDEINNYHNNNFTQNNSHRYKNANNLDTQNQNKTNNSINDKHTIEKNKFNERLYLLIELVSKYIEKIKNISEEFLYPILNPSTSIHFSIKSANNLKNTINSFFDLIKSENFISNLLHDFSIDNKSLKSKYSFNNELVKSIIANTNQITSNNFDNKSNNSSFNNQLNLKKEVSNKIKLDLSDANSKITKLSNSLSHLKNVNNELKKKT